MPAASPIISLFHPLAESASAEKSIVTAHCDSRTSRMGWLWDLTHDKDGGLNSLNAILLRLAALHIVALGVWIFLVLTQKPTRIRDKVDLSKES